ELNRLSPEWAAPSDPDPTGPPLHLPLNTEERRLCRQVITFVYVTLREGAPDEAAEAVARREAEAIARLAAEFWEGLRQHGAGRLPEPSTLPSTQELLEQARQAMTEAKRKARFRTPLP